MNVVGYVLCFIYYVVMFFITNFFQAGIYTIAHARMNGRDLSLGDGLRGAQAAAGKIFVWSLISATVGMVLRTIAERSKIIGKIVAVVLGAAWNILTYFSLPALVISNVSVKESFKLSAATIRKTWGETIIVNVGVGLFFGLTLFGGLALGIGTMILAPSAPVILAVSVLMVVYAVMLIIISSALDAIFKLALYEYAQTGTIPGGFSPDLIRGAVRGGKE
jgi:hypothetical protein